MKKVLLSTVTLFGVLAMGAQGVMADVVEEKTSDGDVAFTTPANGLSLLEVSNFDFGSHEISADSQDYATENDGNAVVQDIRGTSSGWTLQVSQDGQFMNGINELKNAEISILNPTLSTDSTATANVKADLTLLPTGEAITVMDAADGQGNGKAIEAFQTGSASLNVPGETVKVQGGYATTLDWSLSDVVGNI